MPYRLLHLYNTMTRMVEPIQPIHNDLVRMYTCGPTIYDYAHIGNFRTFLAEDLLRRTLQCFGYEVEQVMNITDVDDKTIKGAIAQNVSLSTYTKRYKDAFLEDIKSLRIEPAEYYPEATAFIPKMIDMIEKLLSMKAAYVHDDGSVYFSLKAFAAYGKLSRLDREQLNSKSGSIHRNDSYDQEHVQDFALWKAYDPERDGDIFWESPWGKGRPGWHLECSVMAKDLLGDTIDLHAGGVDLIFPHHENEIAQSEMCTGMTFVRHWMHVEHLLVDHKKMSKSLGNFFTLKDLIQKGFDPISLRYFLLSNHYRSQCNFSLTALDAAAVSIKRIRDCVERISHATPKDTFSESISNDISRHVEKFFVAMGSDLNTSEALSHVFELIRLLNHALDTEGLSVEALEKAKLFFISFDRIFAIITPPQEAIPEMVAAYLAQRQKARIEKNFTLSDQLRIEIEKCGYKVEDSSSGQRIFKI